MKKVQLFAAVLAVSVLAGGATAYTVNKAVTNKTCFLFKDSPSSAEGGTYTTYEKTSYPDLTYAAENAVKGVVNIEIVKEVSSARRGYSNPFEEFFGFGSGQQQMPPREQRGGGSGVIISSDGYIVTNNHVVDGAKEMKVTLNDMRTFDATLIGVDPNTDVALIKIEAKDLPTIPFGNSDDLRLGEWVLAIGYPLGMPSTITAGIISAKARQLNMSGPGSYNIESYIQTDAAVNPGNSGGALVNTAGQLVGINTLIKTETGSYIGYSFAVPSSLVKKVVIDLREHGVVQRAMLGVTMRQINGGMMYDDEGNKVKAAEESGLYVQSTLDGGSAEAAGIKKGDIIIAVDGVETLTSSRLQEEIGKRRPKDKIKVSVKRDGEVKQIDVVLRNLSGSTNVVKKDFKPAVDVLGGTFSDINDRAKKELKIDGGAVVTEVRSGGLLEKARIRKGFTITHINDRKISSGIDINRITEKIESIEGVYPDGTVRSYSFITQ